MAEGQRGSSGIVVLGAGYGGLRAALTLGKMRATRRGLSVTLIDQRTTHHLITEIHRVALGYLPASAARLAVDELLEPSGVRFQQGTVEGIDSAAMCVRLHGGVEVPYSHLVVALGSVADDHQVEGVRAHALVLRSVDDAERIWEHLRAALDEVGRLGPGPARITRETVVVVGAGWTGTELAGELVSFRERQRRVGGVGGTLRIVVLEAGDRVMPGFSARLAEAALHYYTHSGIDLRLGTPVVAVREGGVILADGSEVEAQTVIWTGGVRGTPLLRETGLPLAQRGRLEVNSYLRVPGHRAIYGVGDCAALPGEGSGHMPGPSAQLALHQGEIAAANLAADLSGRPPVTYRPFLLGEALSLGEDDGVTLAGPLLVHGRRALALKRVVNLNYLRSLVGVGRALDALREEP